MTTTPLQATFQQLQEQFAQFRGLTFSFPLSAIEPKADTDQIVPCTVESITVTENAVELIYEKEETGTEGLAIITIDEFVQLIQ